MRLIRNQIYRKVSGVQIPPLPYYHRDRRKNLIVPEPAGKPDSELMG